ncbi:MAG: hypothetical protein WCP55_17645, partial [Lentisphaerota bacterium]
PFAFLVRKTDVGCFVGGGRLMMEKPLLQQSLVYVAKIPHIKVFVWNRSVVGFTGVDEKFQNFKQRIVEEFETVKSGMPFRVEQSAVVGWNRKVGVIPAFVYRRKEGLDARKKRLRIPAFAWIQFFETEEKRLSRVIGCIRSRRSLFILQGQKILRLGFEYEQ